MTTVLLHHYGSSPFAEKIRALLGYKAIQWGSVSQPQVMPKPDLTALTGGYRRIPVLQIGADVYCDTGLIAEVLDALQPSPPMGGIGQEGIVRVMAQWADSQLFWTAMNYNFQPAGAAAMFKDAPPEAQKAFLTDRKAMQSPAPRWSLGDSTAAYHAYLGRIASTLAGQPFLFGDAPSHADFSAYHPLWFTRNIGPLASLFDRFDGVGPWIERMAAFSKQARQHSTKISPQEALSIALASSPLEPRDGIGDSFVDWHGIPIGSEVTIAAESFGLEPVQGKLIAATRTRLTLARHDPLVGLVHVHFPRVGYLLKAVGA
jgi:glutathione S-transferase